MRYQRGYIYEAADAFYVRYYLAGKQTSYRLCSKNDKFYSRTCREVRMLADDFMQSINARKFQGNMQDITVAKFWEKIYLPFAIENLRHSTLYGYRQVWTRHLENHFGKLTLREYRTHMGSIFLTGLSKTLVRSTIQHIRSLASGIFSHALNLGLIESNPWHDVKVLGRTREPEDTKVYSLEEAEDIISALVDHPDCQAVVAVACFVGLRPSEIQGLRWSDIEENWIHVRRAIVRGKETAGKTAGSQRSLPLIRPVRLALAAWRVKAHADEGRVFPRNLKTLIRFVIVPTLEKAGLQWKSLYAGRRCAATVLTSLTGDALAAKELLGHKNIGVTEAKYVKPIPEAMVQGMKLLEERTR